VHREEPPKISPLPRSTADAGCIQSASDGGRGSMKSLTKDAHINQQVLI